MAGIDKSGVCSKYISLLGRQCKINTASGDLLTIRAVIQPVWRRAKFKFLGDLIEVGESKDDFAIYIGPAGFDITALDKHDILQCSDCEYYFIRKEECIVDDRLQYYTGVLKRVYRGDLDACKPAC